MAALLRKPNVGEYVAPCVAGYVPTSRRSHRDQPEIGGHETVPGHHAERQQRAPHHRREPDRLQDTRHCLTVSIENEFLRVG